MFLRYNLFSFIWAGLILFSTVMPVMGLPMGSDFLGIPMDKLVHIVLYMILVFLLTIAFFKQSTFVRLRFRAGIYATVFAVIYGLLMETTQYFLPWRSFEIMDLMANTIGAISGNVLFLAVYRI